MKIWDKIKAIFLRVAKKFREFMCEAWTDIEKMAMVELKEFATAVCLAFQGTDWTNGEKRAEAFAILLKEAVELGYDVGEGVIRELIEAALKLAKKIPVVEDEETNV